MINTRHKENQKKYYNTWMYECICDKWDILNYFPSEFECTEFINKISSKTFYNIMMEYVFLAEVFLNYNFNGLYENIFYNEEWKYMEIITRYIINAKIIDYNDFILKTLNDLVKDSMLFILIIALIYLLLAIIFFTVFWLPYLFVLKDEICRTNLMLLLIPTDVYMNNIWLRNSFEEKVIYFSKLK